MRVSWSKRILVPVGLVCVFVGVTSSIRAATGGDAAPDWVVVLRTAAAFPLGYVLGLAYSALIRVRR